MQERFVTDQFPLEPNTHATEGDAPTNDATARPANSAPRTPSLSIFTRREPAAQTADTNGSPPPIPAVPEPSVEPAFPGLVTTIGRLSHVPAADLWATGAAMAQWLCATPSALSEAVPIAGATFEKPESNVLVGSVPGGVPVCIVCEVGPSTDEGLGVLMRVAAVQDGGRVLWIAGEPGDAHGAALSWLNRSTTPRYALLRVSGIRIDGSASAPMFEVVVRPPRSSAAAAPSDERKRRVEDHLAEQ
jgi:hypothetical protein